MDWYGFNSISVIYRSQSYDKKMMNISLYIPRVFSNISKEFVANTFEKLAIGKVSHVDFVCKMGSDGAPYHSTYVHFDYWFNNEVARNFYDRVIHAEKEARIVYDDPWYWVVLENKGKSRVVNGTNVVNGRKPRINLKTVVAKRPVVPPPPPEVSYEQLAEIKNAIHSLRRQWVEYEMADFPVSKHTQQLFANIYAQEAYYSAYYQFYQELYEKDLKEPGFCPIRREEDQSSLEDEQDYMDENMSIS